MADWIILTMSAPRTLRVVAYLRGIGIEAWSPSAVVRHRVSRSRKFFDRHQALLPTFVFAPAEHLAAVLALTHQPEAGCPAFTVLHRPDGRPYVGRIDLGPLREYEATVQAHWQAFVEGQEREARLKTKRHRARAYVLGQRVKVDKPAFAGLVGKIVDKRRNGDLVIEFSGFSLDATVAACDVAPVQLYCAASEQDEAA